MVSGRGHLRPDWSQVGSRGLFIVAARFSTPWRSHLAEGSVEIGAPDRTCTCNLPADNGWLFYSATRALAIYELRITSWWEVLVTLQFVASDNI